ACTQHLGRDRQNTRTATIVQHRLPDRGVRRQPFQAQVRRRMTARAKGQARVQLNMDHSFAGRDIGMLAMPAGHDPDTASDLYGWKLRLGKPYPIGIRDLAYGPVTWWNVVDAGGADLLEHLRGVESIGQQSHNMIAMPGLNLWLKAGLAKKGALGAGVSVGILYRYGQRAGIQQGIR